MKTILVIEDEQTIRANILTILRFKGFQTLDAADGNQGIRLAKQCQPDLIVCDIMMPDLDGYGVLTMLRQDPDTAAIPFIFLTAKADRSELRQGMVLGADDYLTKPFTSQELIEAVESRIAKQAAVVQPYFDALKQAAENLNRGAYHDPLTNLSNRIWFRHQLQSLLVQTGSQQFNLQTIAVFCLNIDHFSDINTTFGYEAGDSVLQAVAERLRQMAGTTGLVARLSSDEFALVLNAQTDDLAQLAQQMLTAIAQPYRLTEQEIRIRASVGIAVYSKESETADKLLAHAHKASRWCRKQGGGSYLCYSPTMDAIDAEQRAIKDHLKTALEKSEFELYYQPQVNAITGRIIGLEALIRWQHPQLGSVSPGLFIPIAEEMGLIGAIGAWVLETACTQVQQWQSVSLTALRVSVNVSAHQFQQGGLEDLIARLIEQSKLDPKMLVIELTETSVMADVEAAIITFKKLKSFGIEISIDDFGTGYSSLNYLKRLPIDTLKIDKSFISQVTEQEQDAAIVTAIIALAQSLKMKVIAEGVETEEQLAFLRQHGCHAMQGFLYSQPLPASKIQPLLANGLTRQSWPKADL